MSERRACDRHHVSANVRRCPDSELGSSRLRPRRVLTHHAGTTSKEKRELPNFRTASQIGGATASKTSSEESVPTL